MSARLVQVLVLVTFLLVGLKLTGRIGWSWWTVLAPTWVPLVLAGIGGILGVVIALRAAP